MFQAPTRSAAPTPPPPGFDINARYILQLKKLEDQGVSKFADPAKKEDFHNLSWAFQVAHAESKALIYDSEGNPWTFMDFTTSKTGKNPANGMVAKARLWIEALLGHAIEDDEVTADLPQQLIGKVATGFFEMKEYNRQDGTPASKLQIMRLTPYKSTALRAPVEPPPPPPPPEPAPTADELPFR